MAAPWNSLPAVLDVRVNGTIVQFQKFSISAAQGNQDRLSGEYLSRSGSQILDIDDVITVTEDVNLIFGGTIKNPTLGAYGDAAPPAKKSTVSALDFNELATRAPITITIADGTSLKDTLIAVLAVLNSNLSASLQCTLYGSQVTGPTMPQLIYTDTTPFDIFKDLADRTGYVWNLDYARVLRFWLPGAGGSPTAPWNIADNDGNRVGEITITKNRVDYANRIHLYFWEAGIKAYAFFRKTGTISDGEQVVVGGRTYVFKTVLVDTAGFVLIGSDPIGNLNAAINLGSGSGTVYAASTQENTCTSYVFATDTIKVQAPEVGVQGNSVAATTTCAHADWYWEGGGATTTLLGGVPDAITNNIIRDNLTEQATYGIYAKKVEAPNVKTYGDAILLADALLTVSVVVQKQIQYQTYRFGLFPGMMQTIQCASREATGWLTPGGETCLITAVENTWIEGHRIMRTITAVTGTVFSGSKWRDLYRLWSKTGSAGSGSISVSGIVSGGGTTSVGTSVYFLGGSPSIWVQSPTPTWVPIDNDGGIEYTIDTAVRGSLTGIVRARVRAASGTVQVRLLNIDTSTAVGTSAAVSGSSFQAVSFAVTLSSGSHRYRLELLPGSANVDVNGVGYLE